MGRIILIHMAPENSQDAPIAFEDEPPSKPPLSVQASGELNMARDASSYGHPLFLAILSESAFSSANPRPDTHRSSCEDI
jgi:hypothetical protein